MRSTFTKRGETTPIFVFLSAQANEPGKRQVECADAQSFADAQRIPVFLETSAKSGENVEELFVNLCPRWRRPDAPHTRREKRGRRRQFKHIESPHTWKSERARAGTFARRQKRPFRATRRGARAGRAMIAARPASVAAAPSGAVKLEMPGARHHKGDGPSHRLVCEAAIPRLVIGCVARHAFFRDATSTHGRADAAQHAPRALRSRMSFVCSSRPLVSPFRRLRLRMKQKAVSPTLSRSRPPLFR